MSSMKARAGHATGRAYIRFTTNRGVLTIDVNGTIVLKSIIALAISIRKRVRRKLSGGVQNKAILASFSQHNCLGKMRPHRNVNVEKIVFYNITRYNLQEKVY